MYIVLTILIILLIIFYWLYLSMEPYQVAENPESEDTPSNEDLNTWRIIKSFDYPSYLNEYKPAQEILNSEGKKI
jgi:hypothetical protein